jgi:hypothetical protein
MHYTNISQTDGFGSQFQNIIATILYAENTNITFVYNPITQIEHNYNNKSDFINNIEELMNLKNNYIAAKTIVKKQLHYVQNAKSILDANIDLYINSESCKRIKNIFWKNKDKNFFNNNKINIAVHVRRPNSHDNRLDGANTNDKFYLDVINKIRDKNKGSDLLFHIYSQGLEADFSQYKNDDTILYINTDIISTFIGMVAANILVLSRSSLSYTAALLSDGEIYYNPFWHNPAKHWIVC